MRPDVFHEREDAYSKSASIALPIERQGGKEMLVCRFALVGRNRVLLGRWADDVKERVRPDDAREKKTRSDHHGERELRNAVSRAIGRGWRNKFVHVPLKTSTGGRRVDPKAVADSVRQRLRRRVWFDRSRSGEFHPGGLLLSLVARSGTNAVYP